jgi:heme exporter protein C
MILKIVWWKWLSLLMMLYVAIAGFLGPVPRLHIVNESIRNTYFHVPMWFGMIFLLGASVWYSVRFLRSGDLSADLRSASAVRVAILFGILGLLTGMLWANFTWGEAWSNDPKQNASAIGLLIYFGFGLLRASLPEPRERARISAVYSIFAFAVFIPLIWILPRFTDSLHPGNGGNPAFGKYDMNNDMRLVFYPAVIGWTLLGFWMSDLWYRSEKIIFRISANEK